MSGMFILVMAAVSNSMNIQTTEVHAKSCDRFWKAVLKSCPAALNLKSLEPFHEPITNLTRNRPNRQIMLDLIEGRDLPRIRI